MVTTFWPSAASVEASMVDSRTTDASAMPGNTSRPDPHPRDHGQGQPDQQQPARPAELAAKRRRSRRAASLNSSSTSAISVTRSATADSTETSEPAERGGADDEARRGEEQRRGDPAPVERRGERAPDDDDHHDGRRGHHAPPFHSPTRPAVNQPGAIAQPSGTGPAPIGELSRDMSRLIRRVEIGFAARGVMSPRGLARPHIRSDVPLYSGAYQATVRRRFAYIGPRLPDLVDPGPKAEDPPLQPRE